MTFLSDFFGDGEHWDFGKKWLPLKLIYMHRGGTHDYPLGNSLGHDIGGKDCGETSFRLTTYHIECMT